MIQVNNLRKTFGAFKALKGIDIHVDKNDIYGFMGHNGAGKSTTINILAGLSKMDDGKCVIGGVELNKKRSTKPNCIGYLPEEPSFYPYMTAKEYLTFIGSDYDGKVSSRVSEMLEWVGLKKAAKRKVAGFSRGMKQRLGMAVALFYNPDLLLLDEPSSALDPQGRSDVLDMIKRLKDDGKTIFLSTHILDDVERVCNKVGILSSGEMIEEMELTKLMDQYISPIYDLSFLKTVTQEDLKKINKCEWIKNAICNENIVTIKTHDDNQNNHMVYSLAALFDTPLKSVALRGHSLEEIFISMTNKEDKNATSNKKRTA